MLASTFWTLNSLNKTYYNVRISYPLEFVYNPQRFVPLTEPPKELVINVTGKGWKLLRKALNLRIRPARIELPNRLSRNYLTNRQLRPYVNAALSNLVLNYIVTDTVYFNFEPLVHRQLGLALDSAQSFVASGYKVDKPVSIQPPKVKVSGPASLVNALPDPFPVHIPDSLLTEPYRKVVPLAFIPEDLIKTATKQVEVAFKIIPMPIREMVVPVKFLNAPSEKDELPKASVNLRYQLASPSDSQITAASFEVVADLAAINPLDSTVALSVTKRPALVKTVDILPAKVKVNPPVLR